MPAIYDESWIYQPESAPGQNLVLDASESTHLVKVLRLSEGTTCTVVDGKGSVLEAVLERADHKRAELACKELLRTEPAPRSRSPKPS